MNGEKIIFLIPVILFIGGSFGKWGDYFKKYLKRK